MSKRADAPPPAAAPAPLQPDAPPRRPSRWWVTPAVVLALQAALVSAMLFFGLGGLSRQFGVPLQFSDDTLVYLAQSKSTLDNGWWWSNDREGAPFRLNGLLFPSNTNVDQAVIWLVGRVVKSPAAAVNAAWFSMLVLGGLAATFGMRTLGFSWLAAFVTGTLFALSPYALYRHLGHFSLVIYLVPFPATVAVLLASASPAVRWRTFLPLLAGCALIGFNYVYYAFFGCFFIAVALVAGYVRSRDPQVLRAGAAALATICLCVALNFLPSLRAVAHEGSPIVVRDKSAAEAEVYGLKIRQLIAPVFQHTFPPFERWLQQDAAAHFPLENENMISKLGFVATIGFLAVLGAVIFAVATASTDGAAVVAAGRLTIAGLLLSTVGGFGAIFNVLVTPDIRAYNRICPFLAFFGLVAIASAITRVELRWPRAAIGAALAVLAVGLWDQAHVFRSLEPTRPAIQAEYRSLQTFVRAVEAAAPDGASVLQLPFTIYLNDSGLGYFGRMRPYDQFKPYLVSHDLKWSYPALSNAQFAWQEAAGQLALPDLAAFAAASGFRLIFVDRFGYADSGAAVTAALKAIPGVTAINENERYSAFDIGGVAKVTTIAGVPVQDLGSDAPMTPRLTPCAGSGGPTVSLDRVGPAVAPIGAGPIAVERRKDLIVAGWAVTPDGNEPGQDVELAWDNTAAFSTGYGFERPDVAAYLKTPAADPSGFRGSIPVAQLTAGTHMLSVRVLSRTGACFYQAPGLPVVVQ